MNVNVSARVLILVLSVCIFCFLSVSAYASEDNHLNAFNGAISVKQIRQKIEQGKTIHNHVIKGADLIRVIKQTSKAISIESSIITGGLDFSDLPEKSIQKSDFPKHWTDNQRQQLQDPNKRIINTYYIIHNDIDMIDCEIRSDSSNYQSISAGRTFFYNKLNFQGSTFTGDAWFSDAIFAHDLLCQNTQFRGKASFVDAFFCGIVDCQDAFFGAHGAVFIKSHFYCKEVRFPNTRFRFVSFRGAEILGDADFSNTSYEKESYFTNVNFYKSTDFSGAKFSVAVFISTIFHENVLFKKVQMHMASFQEVIFKDDVNFDGTVFTGTVFFNNSQFLKLAEFSNTEFKSLSSQFKNVQFSGNTFFSKARFHGSAIFSKSLFTGKQLVFQESNFLQNIYFVNTNIQSQNIDFHEIVVHGSSNFQGIKLQGDTIFSESRFLQKADFSNAQFYSDADFFYVSFQDQAIFTEACFMREAEFSKNIFNANGNFSMTRFQDLTDFSGSSFRDKADFSKAIFQSETLLKNIMFHRESNFYEAVFHDQVDFFESTFQHLAYFKSSQFYNRLKIKNVRFNGYVDFRNCLVNQLDIYSQKSPTIIKDRVDFRNAWIGSAHFQDVVFENDVDFSGVIFGDKDNKDNNAVVFRFVTFKADVNFIRAVIASSLSMEMITAKGFVNFRDVDFSRTDRIMLSYLNVLKLYIEWSQIPDIKKWICEQNKRIFSFADKQLFNNDDKHRKIVDLSIEPISEVLQMFEEIFQNRLADKNDVIYLRKSIELNEARQSDKFTLKRLQLELEWYFWGIFTGYATKIWWITGWCIFVHFIFSLLYCKGNLSRTYAATDSAYDHTFKQRLFDLPQLFITEKKYVKINRLHMDKFLNAMRFSYVILFKFGYRDTTISGKIFGLDYALIVWIEWVLGFFLLSFLAVTLSNTMPLVNRLISGVL
jgi:uncharacterized protein YjbI with pentapeptide repeats